MREFDPMLLLQVATYSDWHVDIEKPETSVVFREVNDDGERMAEARPLRVPPELQPVLEFMVDWLRTHRAAGDQLAFAFDLETFRYRGERMRPNRYALRRAEKEVPGLERLNLGTAAEDLLLDPELRQGGLLLIAGETGAGKSTTARATIKSRLMKYGGYALGVESPVEVDFEGFHGDGYLEQVDATLTGYKHEVASAMRKFPAATRSMFYFGEVLEEKSAAELVRLAPRGHLVVTTIHADSVESAIRMLIAMAEQGGESYARQHLGAALRGVIHQKMSKGRPIATPVKANASIRNIIQRADLPLANLTAEIDNVRRAASAQAMRSAVQQPRMSL